MCTSQEVRHICRRAGPSSSLQNTQLDYTKLAIVVKLVPSANCRYSLIWLGGHAAVDGI